MFPPVFTITFLRTFAARGITATAGHTCPGQNAKFFTGFWVKNFVGCSFTLDSQCGRLWLYQPRRQGLIRVCGTRQAMSRDPPQRREARFAKRRCALHPGGLLPGCRERRPRRDRGGATGTVAASQGFASGMEARQGGDSFAGSVHDSPPHQGDARKSHKQERNGKKRKKRKRKKKKNSNRHGNHRKITSEKNIPDTSQTGRVTGDASAWPASLPAGVSLPGVFARADRRPPPPALYHLFLLPCKM